MVSFSKFMTLPKKIAWGVLLLLAAIISVQAFRYAAGDFQLVQGPVRYSALNWPGALLIHVLTAAIALLVGPWQFLPGIRNRLPRVHRLMGRTYVAACIAGGISGLILAVNSGGGPVAQAGFGLLGMSWLASTAFGFQKAITGDFAAHRRWMIRSFALAMAAITLRIYLPAAMIAGLEFMPAYRVIAWMCWIPNLLVAELFLIRPLSRRAIPVVELPKTV